MPHLRLMILKMTVEGVARVIKMLKMSDFFIKFGRRRTHPCGEPKFYEKVAQIRHINRSQQASIAIFRIIGLLLATGLYATSALSAPQPIKDLNYGVALYSFYQYDYFDAISELMRAEQRGGVKGHGNEPILLKGGIMLSYGITRQAENIFAAHIGDASQPTRDQAWYYVGKLAVQRGDFTTASNAFKRVGNSISGRNKDDFHLLAGTTELQLKKFDYALNHLKSVGDESVFFGYANYNIGVLERSRKRLDAAIKAFDHAVDLPPPNAEQSALRDAALLAKAETLGETNDIKHAIDAYRQVSLTGPLSNQGLLEYGWAAVKHDDVKQALAPWQELTKRNVLDPYVQEAFLGLPYVYERLQMDGAAAEAYEAAAARYATALSQLDTAQQDIKKPTWLTLLLAKQIHADNASETHLNALLANLISQSEFQHSLNNLRDLDNLRHMLTVWQQDIESLSAMIEARHLAFKNAASTFDPSKLQHRLNSLIASRDALESIIATASDANNATPMMSQQEASQMQLLTVLEKRANKLPEQNKTDFLARCQILRGILLWDAEFDEADRIWSARKRLNEVNALIDTVREKLNNLADARNTVGKNKEQTLQKLSQRRASITTFKRQLSTVYASQVKALQLLANTEIESQRKRIKHYLAYTRLALTRLYDKTPEQPHP